MMMQWINTFRERTGAKGSTTSNCGALHWLFAHPILIKFWGRGSWFASVLLDLWGVESSVSIFDRLVIDGKRACRRDPASIVQCREAVGGHAGVLALPARQADRR